MAGMYAGQMWYDDAPAQINDVPFEPIVHSMNQLLMADLRRIHWGVTDLELEVYALHGRVYDFDYSSYAANVSDMRQYLTSELLAELVWKARNLREYLKMAESLVPLAAWEQYQETVMSHHMHNRLLHVEQYWIRIIISTCPYSLSIDYNTLVWDGGEDDW